VALKKAIVKKRCEIQGGGQEMEVMDSTLQPNCLSFTE